MPSSFGTESAREFFYYELAGAAHKFLAEIMLVKPGEQVAITIDTSGDWRVAQVFAQQAYVLGATPSLILYQTQPSPQMEPPKPVAGAVAAAQVWIDFAVQYILYTQARQAASENGCRHACLSGMNVDAIVRTIGMVDYRTMIMMGDSLVQMHNETSAIHVSCQNGTDLYAEMQGNAHQAGGLASQPGALVMLGGQVGLLPKEETISGKLVIDGCIWPPAEIGVLSPGEKVILHIKAGRIAKVEGGAAATRYETWLKAFNDPNLFRMAHYVYGFNPGVSQLTGRIVEDERFFGSMTFGFGGTSTRKAASHTDCILLYPSVELDGMPILHNGHFCHEKLVQFCQDMGINGY